MKTVIIAAIMAIAPALAAAACGDDRVTMSCAEGTVFDQERGACVPVTG